MLPARPTAWEPLRELTTEHSHGREADLQRLITAVRASEAAQRRTPLLFRPPALLIGALRFLWTQRFAHHYPFLRTRSLKPTRQHVGLGESCEEDLTVL